MFNERSELGNSWCLLDPLVMMGVDIFIDLLDFHPQIYFFGKQDLGQECVPVLSSQFTMHSAQRTVHFEPSMTSS